MTDYMDNLPLATVKYNGKKSLTVDFVCPGTCDVQRGQCNTYEDGKCRVPEAHVLAARRIRYLVRVAEICGWREARDALDS